MDKTRISEMAGMTLLRGFCSITVRLFLAPFLVGTGSGLPFVLEERFVFEEWGGVIGVAVAVGHVYYSQVSYCCARGSIQTRGEQLCGNDK